MKTQNRHPSPQFQAWAGLLRSHKLLIEQIQGALVAAQMPPLEWYDVLLELDFAEDGRLRFFDLGERIVLSRSNLTRLIDRMEKEGLLLRENCADDRRGLFAVISDKGRELRKTMWPVYRDAVQASFAAQLTDDEAQQLYALLRKVVSTVELKKK